ncbi:protein of unknown function [Cupriavidus neocaledonicus]|uniref:Uncharacterized protein n=1 Tax=Cupriavidus neocaledonicus TaxID=1040979 RepID=A0A375H3M7_9BURK|nr:hypothetical protein CBM2605_A10030 [Cupriavidus neocaledonicus]SPD45073.1 protein of unknown function [Cupriavidus neocaledonicus]
MLAGAVRYIMTKISEISDCSHR